MYSLINSKRHICLLGHRGPRKFRNLMYNDSRVFSSTQINNDSNINTQEPIKFENWPGPGWFGPLHLILTGSPEKNEEMIYKNYGKKYKVAMTRNFRGEKEALLYNHDDIRHVLMNEGKFPHGSAKNIEKTLGKYLATKFGKDNISTHFFGNGLNWRATRDKLGPGLNSASTELYLEQINKAAEEAVNFLPLYIQNNEVDFWTKTAAYDMFHSLVFGNMAHTSNPKFEGKYSLRKMVHLEKKTLSKAVQLAFTHKIFHKKGEYEDMCESFDKLFEISEPLIRDFYKECNESSPSSWFKDLKIKQGVTLEELLHLMPTFLSAGIGTTQGIVQWLLLTAAEYPEKQDKLYDEIKTVLRGKAYHKDVQLPYLDAFIRETHRFRPSSPIFTMRTLEHDITLPSGYEVPAGVSMLLKSTQVNRDEDFVENCNEFLPERFLIENVKKRKGCPVASTLDHRTTKDPFGLGKRICLGKRAAQLEIKCLLINVITKYRIELADGEKPALKRKTKMDTVAVPEQIPPLKLMTR